jgi:hypothetical protein
MIKNRKVRNGGSGLYLNETANDKEAFSHFLNNSTARPFRQGSNGITFILTLKDNIVSKYLSLDATTYSQPVPILLVKTVFISPQKIKILTNMDENNHVYTASKDDFAEEVNIQTMTYLKTMEYLQPLCPAIVYADILNPYDANLNIFKFYSLLRQIDLSDIAVNNIRVGIIAMEFIEDPIPLYHLIDRQEEQLYNNFRVKSCHTIIEFVIKTGYTHGDFHDSNLVIDPHVKNYFASDGAVKIIDFGYATKLSPEVYNKFKELYDKQEYVKFMNALCDIPRKDGYDLRSYNSYMYSCLRESPFSTNMTNQNAEFNVQIKQLYKERDEYIKLLQEHFKQTQLPLTNNSNTNVYREYKLDDYDNLNFNFDNVITPEWLIDMVDTLVEQSGYNMHKLYYGFITFYALFWIINTVKDKNITITTQDPDDLYMICYCISTNMKLPEDLNNEDAAKMKSLLDDVKIDTIYNYIAPKNMNEYQTLIELFKTELPYKEPKKAADKFNELISGHVRVPAPNATVDAPDANSSTNGSSDSAPTIVSTTPIQSGGKTRSVKKRNTKRRVLRKNNTKRRHYRKQNIKM